MKTIPALVLAAVLAVGLLGGLVAYQVASGPTGPDPSAAAATTTTPAAVRTHRPRPKVRWAPCKPPALRQGKACVTEEVRTVVVPAPPAPAAPAIRPVRTGGRAAPAPAAPAADGRPAAPVAPAHGRQALPFELYKGPDNVFENGPVNGHDNGPDNGNNGGGNGNNGGEHEDD